MTVERHAFWELYPEAFGWSRLFVYIVAAITMAIFAYGLYLKIKLWRAGKPAPGRLSNIPSRINHLIRYGFAQVKVLADAYPGFFHATIFFGFVLLFIGTSLTVLDEDLYRLITGSKFIQGPFYVVFSLILDIAGLAAIFGLAMAAWRRYGVKSERLDNKSEDATLLILILLILVTGFLSEAIRISHHMYPFEKYSSPLGFAMAMPFAAMGDGGRMAAHAIVWFTHLFLAMIFIGSLPWTKAFHIVAGWFNVFTAELGPRGGLPAIPNMMERMENDEEVEMGYKSVADLTWKDRLMVHSCTRCGRCQEACPAVFTGKPLNPKQVVQDLLGAMLADPEGKLLKAEDEAGALSTEVLWDCTNCMACMNACPVLIEHIPLIVQMRRELAMEFDDMGSECRLLFKNMDVNANPWGMAPDDRGKWAEGLDVPSVLENPEFEYLFYVGCMASFDERSKKVARAVAKILKAANVNFAIMGEMELCCGDPIRRLGNEASFQAIVGMTKEMLAEAEVTVRKVITLCPHCYNTLEHEYKDFGLDWDVVHHSVFIAELIQSGKLALTGGDEIPAVFHDSCFLGRYNDLYEQPREAAKAAGAKLVEHERSRENGFCCGGGGGRLWLEEEAQEGHQRINLTRISQMAETGAKTFLLACPYCMTMFDEGAKLTEVKKGDANWNRYVTAENMPEDDTVDLFELVELLDIAELVERRLDPKSNG
jgi:Fe-S oxidoreductase/nitrate reductase gamma subunit